MIAPNKRRDLIFDLDGTLTDSAEGILRCTRYALQKLSLPLPPEETLRKFIGPPLLGAFTDLCGLDQETALQCVYWYRERYREIGWFENRVYDGIPEALRQLKSKGKRLFVATSKPEPFAIRILEKFGLAPDFDLIAGSLLDNSRSQKAEVLTFLMETASISPDDAVMIGDRFYDVNGAKEVGLPCVGVLYGFGDANELSEAGACQLVSTPQELARYFE